MKDKADRLKQLIRSLEEELERCLDCINNAQNRCEEDDDWDWENQIEEYERDIDMLSDQIACLYSLVRDNSTGVRCVSIIDYLLKDMRKNRNILLTKINSFGDTNHRVNDEISTLSQNIGLLEELLLSCTFETYGG